MLYFSYGSDLNRHAILDWSKATGQFVPPRTTPKPAVLANYRLCFPTYDGFWRGGVADAVPEIGKSVSGVLFTIDATAMRLLDQMAGVPEGGSSRVFGPRRRSTVLVKPYKNREVVEAITHRIWQPEQMHVPPSELYMQRLVDAAWEFGLTTMWIMHVRSFPTQISEQPAINPVLRTASVRLSDIGLADRASQNPAATASAICYQESIAR